MKISEKLEFYDHVNVGKAWSEFMSKRNAKKRMRNLRMWTIVGGVAAAIVAIAIVGVQLYDSNDEASDMVAYSGAEVTPKYEHATITVGGKTIELCEGSTVSGDDGSVVRDADGNILYNNVDSEPMLLSVPRGGEYSMILSDGTKVWLNAESELEFPSHFSSNTRTVTLKGEAYMEVAKDVRHPFLVQVGDAQVHVKGTRFNVRHYNDEKSINVTLVSGAVSMEEKESGKNLANLTPGNQFTYDTATAKFSVTAADISSALAWHNGIFVFEQETVAAMAVELSRWYDIQIDVDPSVAHQRYSGELNRSESIEPLLKVLRRTGELDFVKTNTGMRIIKRNN